MITTTINSSMRVKPLRLNISCLPIVLALWARSGNASEDKGNAYAIAP